MVKTSAYSALRTVELVCFMTIEASGWERLQAYLNLDIRTAVREQTIGRWKQQTLEMDPYASEDVMEREMFLMSYTETMEDVIETHCNSQIMKSFIYCLSLVANATGETIFVHEPSMDYERERATWNIERLLWQMLWKETIESLPWLQATEDEPFGTPPIEYYLEGEVVAGRMTSHQAVEFAQFINYEMHLNVFTSVHVSLHVTVPAAKIHNKEVCVDAVVWIPHDDRVNVVAERDVFALDDGESLDLHAERNELLRSHGFYVWRMPESILIDNVMGQAEELWDFISLIRGVPEESQ